MAIGKSMAAIWGAALGLGVLGACDHPQDRDRQEQLVEDETSPALATVNSDHDCLTAASDEIQWHSCNGPNSVQFGQPGTDLRGVRMDCIDGELSLAFSIPWDEHPRELVMVEFPNGRQIRGEEIELGDGINAWIKFDDADNLPLDLVEGEYFEFTFEGALYSFPVGEGRRLVEDLVESCQA